MDFLWVRWLGVDRSYNAGWAARRLHRVSFKKADDPSAFGFLDPSQVIRGIHLIPAFAHGTTDFFLGPSIARIHPAGDTQDADWRFLYVNM